MKREIAMKLDGKDLVQTTSRYDDDGVFQEETVIRLGERETVLAHYEDEVAKATKTRDGMASPAASKPPPPGDGPPGKETTYWLDGRAVVECEVERDAKGKVRVCRSRALGAWAQRLENAEERLAELSELLDKAKKAT